MHPGLIGLIVGVSVVAFGFYILIKFFNKHESLQHKTAIESLTKKFPKLLQPRYWKLTECRESIVRYGFDNTGEFKNYQEFTVSFEEYYKYGQYTNLTVPSDLLTFLNSSEREVLKEFLINEFNSDVKNQKGMLLEEIRSKYI